MSTVSLVITKVSGKADGGSIQPVPDATPASAESITSSSSSQPSSNSVPASDSHFAVVTVTGGNVWVKFGADPTAAAGDDWLILDGQTRSFSVNNSDKMAVIDA